MSDNEQPIRIRSARDYAGQYASDWCAGCGDFGILRALQSSLAALQLPPDQVAVFGGIGCSGKTPYYLSTYGVHTLHGRVLPFASGAKLAKPELTVIAVGGDGDALSIGGGHLINAARRNLDITYILYNNGVYGLTKGQAAPTLRLGEKTHSMAQGNIQQTLSPMAVGLAAGYSWLGRGYAYDVAGLTALLEQAIRHPGTALLEVLQPCPTYNDVNSKAWYEEVVMPLEQSRLYSLSDDGYDGLIPAGSDSTHIAAVQQACMERALQWGERIPTGVFLQDLSRSEFLSRLAAQQPHYRERPAARQPVTDETGHPLRDLTPIYETLRVARDD